MVNLRGGLRGLGVGLTALGAQGVEEQQRQAADRRLLDRETAFARIQQGIRREDQDEDVKRDLGRAVAETPVLVEREAATLKVREPYRQRERADAAAAQTSNREDQQAHDVAMESIRHEHRVSEQVDQETRRLEAEARTRGQVVSHWQVDAQGFLQGFNANGEVIAQSRAPHYTPPGRSREDDDLGLDEPHTAPPPPPAPSSRRTLTARPAARQGNEQPPFPGARRAPDGHWYVTRQGRNFRVEE